MQWGIRGIVPKASTPFSIINSAAIKCQVLPCRVTANPCIKKRGFSSDNVGTQNSTINWNDVIKESSAQNKQEIPKPKSKYQWSTLEIQLQHKSGISTDPEKTEIIDSIIRVDHAGEFGAQRIYDGQLAVLSGSPVEGVVREMAAQENAHLKVFEDLVRERRVRPTILHPIWHAVGFAAGAGSALLGKEAAMALTVAVEDVISEHYNSQLRTMNDLGYTELPEDKALKKVIKEFRDDELEHLDTGLKHDAEKTFLYEAFTGAIKAGTTAAIWLSTRI